MSITGPLPSGSKELTNAVTAAGIVAAAPAGGILISHDAFTGISVGLGFLGVILARMVYVSQENKRLRRQQKLRETMPLTGVALIIAMPVVWQHNENITLTPLIGLGVGYSSLLLLKMLGRAAIVGARSAASELANALRDSPGDHDIPHDMQGLIDRIDEIPDDKL